MSKYRRLAWSIGSIIVLGVFVNVIIIIAACIYMPNLFWVLLITIPLLIVGIYTAKQTNHLLAKYRIINLQVPEKQSKYEWPSPSIYPNKIDEADLKVTIGNDQCSQPYDACILNVGSMRNTHPKKYTGQPIIDKKLDCAKNSYEERLPTYSLAGDGHVGQIGPNYIGCRTGNGNFNSKVFRENACRPEVKMIELILSTAIKSVHNADSSLNSRAVFNAKTYTRTFPSSSYSTFSDAEGMIHFLDSLRELSGGKPIGMRLSIIDKKEFREICHAIRKTQLIPDFIVVEGSFESTSTVHAEKGIPTIMPLYEALIFVSQTLQIYGLENEIKIIASGKIISYFDILKVLALGACAVCTEMPGYGIYDRKTSSLYKAQNINDFHNNLMKATIQAMKVCGFMNVSDITLSRFFRRLDVLHSKGFEENGHVLYPGTVKKIYNSRIKTYGLQEKRKKESIM